MAGGGGRCGVLWWTRRAGSIAQRSNGEAAELGTGVGGLPGRMWASSDGSGPGPAAASRLPRHGGIRWRGEQRPSAG